MKPSLATLALLSLSAQAAAQDLAPALLQGDGWNCTMSAEETLSCEVARDLEDIPATARVDFCDAVGTSVCREVWIADTEGEDASRRVFVRWSIHFEKALGASNTMAKWTEYVVKGSPVARLETTDRIVAIQVRPTKVIAIVERAPCSEEQALVGLDPLLSALAESRGDVAVSTIRAFLENLDDEPDVEVRAPNGEVVRTIHVKGGPDDQQDEAAMEAMLQRRAERDSAHDEVVSSDAFACWKQAHGFETDQVALRAAIAKWRTWRRERYLDAERREDAARREAEQESLRRDRERLRALQAD